MAPSALQTMMLQRNALVGFMGVNLTIGGVACDSVELSAGKFSLCSSSACRSYPLKPAESWVRSLRANSIEQCSNESTSWMESTGLQSLRSGNCISGRLWEVCGGHWFLTGALLASLEAISKTSLKEMWEGCWRKRSSEHLQLPCCTPISRHQCGPSHH